MRGKAVDSSRAVPRPSTNPALRRLTSGVWRDPVHSTRCGRQRVAMDMTSAQLALIAFVFAFGCVCKAGSTLRSSRAVPHPRTNRALRRLTSEVGRDPVHSTRYGRQRLPMDMASAQFAGIAFVLALWCGCKAGSTLRSPRAVPHPSTNRALCRLTSEVRRDPVHSTRYGRQRKWKQGGNRHVSRTVLAEPWTSDNGGLRVGRGETCFAQTSNPRPDSKSTHNDEVALSQSLRPEDTLGSML